MRADAVVLLCCFWEQLQGRKRSSVGPTAQREEYFTACHVLIVQRFIRKWRNCVHFCFISSWFIISVHTYTCTQARQSSCINADVNCFYYSALLLKPLKTLAKSPWSKPEFWNVSRGPKMLQAVFFCLQLLCPHSLVSGISYSFFFARESEILLAANTALH